MLAIAVKRPAPTLAVLRGDATVRKKEVTVRKYFMNGSIISAIVSGFSTLKSTKSGPNDWRIVLSWVAWALTLAVAVGTVHYQSKDAEFED